MLYPVPLNERVSQSDVVVEGKVIKKTCFWNQDRTNIFTANVIEIHKVFKGTASLPSLVVVTPGGRIDDKKQIVRPSLQLQTGDYGIFFLSFPLTSEEWMSKNAPVEENAVFCKDHAGPQTFIRLEEGKVRDIFFDYANQNQLNAFYVEMYHYTDAANIVELKPTPAEFLLPHSANRAAPVISSFSPSNVKAGTLSAGSLLTINGSNFGATRGTSYVQFRSADDGGASYTNSTIAADYQSWSATQIIVRVPDDAGTGTFQVVVPGGGGGTGTSPSTLTVDYATITVVSSGVRYETDLVSDNGTGGYTLTFNNNFYSNAAAVAALRRALASWVGSTNVNFKDAGATTSTITAASNDGTNIITFANLSSGVLGVSYSSFGGCSPDGSNWYWYVSDLDLRFQNQSNLGGLTWNYSTSAPTLSQYDFESVALHELGHHHQLTHVINAGAVMHYSIGNGDQSRVLSANDIAAGQYVLSHSTSANPCGPGPMTMLPVELLYFAAKPVNDNHIELHWQTASESNSEYFILERGTDGVTFETITQIKAAGNSNTIHNYFYQDNKVAAAVVYYRLKQTGFNGHVQYSKIVSVRNRHHAFQFLSLNPNPSNGKFMLKYTLEENSPLHLRVFDLTGKLITNSWMQSVDPGYELIIDLTEQPNGIYFLHLLVKGQSVNLQLVKE